MESPVVAKIIAFLEKRSPALITALSLTLLAAVASLDYHLGHRQLSFFVFYLIPIAVVALYGRRTAATASCLIATGVVTLINHVSSHAYPDGLAMLWNTGGTLVVFLLTAYLFDRLKVHLALIDVLLRKDELTGALNPRGFHDDKMFQWPRHQSLLVPVAHSGTKTCAARIEERQARRA